MIQAAGISHGCTRMFTDFVVGTDCRRSTTSGVFAFASAVRAVREERAIYHEIHESHESGYRVTYLPVDRDGLLKLADLEDAITDDTAVVSVLNEANGSHASGVGRHAA